VTPLEKHFKKKLLVVTTTFPRWQNDTDPPFVFELSKRLVKDFDITVHTPHYRGSEYREVVDSIRVHRFKYFTEKFEKLAGQTAILPFLRDNKGYWAILPCFLLSQFCSLILLIYKLKPDVIHVHWLIPSCFFAVCGNILNDRVPIIVTCHGADIFGFQSFFFKQVKKWVIKRVQGVVVVSNALKREIGKVPLAENKYIEIIPMGVDSELFNPRRYSASLKKSLKIQGAFLLFVGRLTEKKGVSYLLDAIKIIKDQGYDITLVIIGAGEERESLISKADSLKLSETVKFIGAVPNEELPKYYATADIFVGPSVSVSSGDSEGFGVTFVEASMSGCFLIGTLTGGITDIIDNGKTGRLAQPNDCADLADKILWALENPVDVLAQKECSRERCIRKFDWNIIAKIYSDFLLQEIEKSEQNEKRD